MPYARPYNRLYSFQNFQRDNPSRPAPADRVDAEFNEVKLALDQTQANLKKIQRSDGYLGNGIVTQDSLSPSLSIGFTFRGPWSADVNYVKGDGVSLGTKFYIAQANHLSTTGNSPEQASSLWKVQADFEVIVDASQAAAFLAPGNSVGDAIRARAQLASNLLDLPNKALARTNLGLSAAATVTDSVRAAPGNPVGDALADRARIGLCRSPWDKGANGLGAGDDTAFLQQCINEIQSLQNSAFISHGIIDGRGGTFAISSPLTMTGSPYNITFQNMAIIPYQGYAGDFFDFRGCTATTKLRFDNLVLNGYNQARHLIRMSPKTQGTTVTRCCFYGWTGAAFLDEGRVAAQENQIVNNVFQGGSTNNQGIAIELYGNDNEILDNLIYNVAVGIRTHDASHTISRNHIYSADVNQPIPLVYADTGDQMQVVANYLDEGYVFFKNPSGLQYIANRILYAGNIPASQFNPIVFQPSSANATFLNVLITGNLFRNLLHGGAPNYTPVKIDTSTGGSVGTLYNCHMKDNGFYGFNEQTTEPSGWAYGTNANTFGVDFSAKLPFGKLYSVTSVVPRGPGFGSISSVTIGPTGQYENTVYVNFGSAQTGSVRVSATVNA